LTEVGLASISVLAITEGEIHKQKPSTKFGCHSAANLRFGDQISAVGRFGPNNHVADITKIFGAEAALLEDEKCFFR
jgi:hypothetical protein